MLLMELPSELWDRVIDFVSLQDDHRHSQTKLVSLVNKSFLPRSRIHIFETILLDGRIGTPNKFLRLLGESPHLGLYVTDLILEEGRDRTEQERRWLSSALPVLRRYLPNVERLSLCNLEWDALSELAKDSLLEGFQEVTSLDFHHSRMPDFRQLVASFPKLRTLGNPPYPFSSVNRLNNLPPASLERVQCRYWELLSLWLLERDDPRLALHTLVMPYLLKSQITPVQTVLDAFGEQLWSLNVSFWKPEEIFLAESVITLSPLKYLRKLTMDNLVFYAHSGTPYLAWLTPFLSNISSACLETVMFRVWMERSEELDCVDWNALDRLLERELWRESLKAVRFQIWGETSTRAAEAQAIRERLPRTALRGLLEFDLGAANEKSLASVF